MVKPGFSGNKGPTTAVGRGLQSSSYSGFPLRIRADLFTTNR